MIGKIAYFVCVCALPIAAVADDFPKQGTANYTDYSVLVAPRSMALGKAGSITVYEVNGVSRNDDGNALFDNMAVRCLGESMTIGSDVSVRGACVQVDKDGDQIFVNYDYATTVQSGAAGGTDHFVGGTGKYAGIAGKADFTRQIVKGPDGTIMLILPHHAAWATP